MGLLLPWTRYDRRGSDGYNINRPIRGFSQMHVSGTGGPGNYGLFLVSPQIGLDVSAAGHDSEKVDERAAPFYYGVTLSRYGVRTEVAPTHHGALYRFQFPAGAHGAHLVFDLGHSTPHLHDQRGAEAGQVRLEPDGTWLGWGRYTGAWIGAPTQAYFAARVSVGPTSSGTFRNGALHAGAHLEDVVVPGDRFGAWMRLPDNLEGPVFLKVAVSLRSAVQARHWLDRELPDWSFDRVLTDARHSWERTLSRIEVEGGTPEERTIFASALFRAHVMPSDRTQDGPETFGDDPYWDDQYTVWDTFRTLYPLMALIDADMVHGNIQSFISRFRRLGEVDDAFVAGNGGGIKDMYRQGGDDSDVVIADAFVKGVPGVDWNAAYEIVRHDAETRRRPSYLAHGWADFESAEVPASHSPVSHTLEFALNDASAAMMARRLGHAADATRWAERSQSWANLWDASATVTDGELVWKGFVQPRRANGAFVALDPRKWQNYMGPAFQEGSAWIYSFFVPQDLPGLIARMGGAQPFVARLSYALDHDLIDFSNEPSFLTLRAFTFAGRPDLTSLWVRRALGRYTTQAYPGDEDSGAMSSWYVLSAIGLFPNAGSDLYLLNAPIFTRARLHLSNGRTFTVEAPGASAVTSYVQSATLNGRPLRRAWLRHAEIAQGGVLRLVLGPRPSPWGQAARPPAYGAEP